MPDEHFLVALRLRLRIPHAGHVATQPAEHEKCSHIYAQSGNRCGHDADSRCHHALTCNVGGGVDHRHNAVRDWLAQWLRSVSGQRILEEQFVPKWDRVVRRGNEDVIERARLDLVFADRQGRRTYADIVIPTASSDTPELVRSRAARDGAAAARAEDGKRLRYPGPDLVPFAVEALGRPGTEGML